MSYLRKTSFNKTRHWRISSSLWTSKINRMKTLSVIGFQYQIWVGLQLLECAVVLIAVLKNIFRPKPQYAVTLETFSVVSKPVVHVNWLNTPNAKRPLPVPTVDPSVALLSDPESSVLSSSKNRRLSSRYWRLNNKPPTPPNKSNTETIGMSWTHIHYK